MSAREEHERAAEEMAREELEAFYVDVKTKRTDGSLRSAQTKRDLREAELEMSGDRLPLQMPTILDSHVRISNDDGSLDWKTRDEASIKEHMAHQEFKSANYLAASGIALRKRDKESDWAAEQGDALDHEAPIGPQVFEGTICVICGRGYEACATQGPFVRAHYVAHALGGDETDWAHKRCNEMEGVG